MEQVVLVIHLILALAIIGLVLLQRSEGGGLGIGGSGGLGGLASPGSTAGAMTKATAFCAACFFATSLILGILAGSHGGSSSIAEQLGRSPAPIGIIEEESGTAIPQEIPEKRPAVPVE